MDRNLLARIDAHVIGWGVAISLGSAALLDLTIFLSVLVGALIAVVNWVGFRWLGVRITAASTKHRGRFAVFLALKMAAILGIIALVLRTGKIDSLAFLVGLSALVLGVLSRSVLQAIAEGEASLKEEDR